MEESNPPFDPKDAVPVKETSSLEPLDPSVAASNHTVENLSCGSLPPDVNHVSIPHSVVTSPSEGLTGTENLKASAENVNTSDLRKDVEFEGVRTVKILPLDFFFFFFFEVTLWT